MLCILVTGLAICRLIRPTRLCLHRTLATMQPWQICCISPSSYVGVSTSYWGNWPSTLQNLHSKSMPMQNATACFRCPSIPLFALARVALSPSSTEHAKKSQAFKSTMLRERLRDHLAAKLPGQAQSAESTAAAEALQMGRLYRCRLHLREVPEPLPLCNQQFPLLLPGLKLLLETSLHCRGPCETSQTLPVTRMLL